MILRHLSRTPSLVGWCFIAALGCSSAPAKNDGSGGDPRAPAGGNSGGNSAPSTSTQGSFGGSAPGATQSGGTASASFGDPSTNPNIGGTNNDSGAGGTSALVTPKGGADGAGGSGNSGSASTTAQGGSGIAASTTCAITVKSATYSPVIGSVGIVTWATTLTSLDKAQIDFGIDKNYGMTAPVDLAQKDYRTLLLGMKHNHEPYHFRISAQSGSSNCSSTDQVFSEKTAPRPNEMKVPTTTTNNRAALYGGFLVVENFKLNTPDDYAYILDADGDVVWWYHPNGFGSLSVAKMTYDGKSMWIANDNVGTGGIANVGKVSMDGLDFVDTSGQFKGLNHDLTVLPDETVIFIAYGSKGEGKDCDDIVERLPDGTTRTIVNARAAFGNATTCHCNAIQYSKDDDSVIVSDDDHSAYFKTDRRGNIKWVLNGGQYNSFDAGGGGATGWTGNHNLHVLGRDHIVLFNNGVAAATPGTSKAVIRELKLDLTNMTTTEIWKYEAGISNAVMGDVQRLDNGNTLVAYSTAGTVHEVDADKNILQKLVWTSSSGAGIGYITKRRTLYGQPPR